MTTDLPARWRQRRPARSTTCPTPYLFSDNDIAALLAAAGDLRPALRAATHQTLFGLLVVTGMRIGEAIAARPRRCRPGLRATVHHQRQIP